MVKYKFSNKTMFAIVMRDETVCKEFIERLFPERKVREIHFAEPEPFYTYVDTGKVDENDLLTRMIDERVERVNSDEEVSGAMTLEEEIKIQREYGLEEGLERGAAQKQREIAKNLKIIGVAADKIAEATGLSPSEVENL